MTGRAPMAPAPGPAGERGIALVMAMLVLLVMSLLTLTLMLTVNVDSKIAGHGVRGAQALNVAEAGVVEASARIRSGDVPNNLNPRMVAQIYLAAPGSVPVVQPPDSVAMATAQPAGGWLPYSTAGKGPDVLTVQYKTDSLRTLIYRYDASKNPAVQTATGLPVFVIHSTGRRGNDLRRVRAEVIQKPVTSKVNAALAANVGIEFTGNSDVCGYNHRLDTPSGTKGRPPCNAWEHTSGHLPGAWSTGSISGGGSSTQNGSPAAVTPGQTGFYAGPWEALSMTQAEFFAWIGAPLKKEPAAPNGLYYLDNNAVSQDRSGDFKYNGGTGEGMLYVDGNLAINGNFTYRGLIYIEGDLKINGTCWILGGIVVRGKSKIKIANGSCTVLYSADAISQALSRFGGQFITLAWREY